MNAYVEGLIARARQAADVLGKSVAYIKGKTGITVSDAQVDAATAKARALKDGLTKLLEEYIDDVPGVPNFVAHAAAQAATMVVDAAIAGAGEAIKRNN